MSLEYNGVTLDKIFMDLTLVEKVYFNTTLVYQNKVLVEDNTQAYAQVAQGNNVYTADKGDLFLNPNGVLQASDGSRLGKSMDVWFLTDSYALYATSFAYGCYRKSTNRRCYDNKRWLKYTHHTATQSQGAWVRTVYVKRTAWR